MEYLLTPCLFSVPDGKVCINDKGELAVTKFAVEPVRKHIFGSRSRNVMFVADS